MKTTQHTTHPWKFGGANSWEIYSAPDGKPICKVSTAQKMDEELRANVQLIAAAPDLYEAGREVLAWMMTVAKDHPDAFEKLKQLDAALSKAEGRTAYRDLQTA